jgi:hypothetical protein
LTDKDNPVHPFPLYPVQKGCLDFLPVKPDDQFLAVSDIMGVPLGVSHAPFAKNNIGLVQELIAPGFVLDDMTRVFIHHDFVARMLFVEVQNRPEKLEIVTGEKDPFLCRNICSVNFIRSGHELNLDAR